MEKTLIKKIERYEEQDMRQMQDENERHNNPKSTSYATRNNETRQTKREERERGVDSLLRACWARCSSTHFQFALQMACGTSIRHYFLQVGMSSSWRCIRFSFRKQLGLLVVGRNC
jgi:hypothetical protein